MIHHFHNIHVYIHNKVENNIILNLNGITVRLGRETAYG